MKIDADIQAQLDAAFANGDGDPKAAIGLLGIVLMELRLLRVALQKIAADGVETLPL